MDNQSILWIDNKSWHEHHTHIKKISLSLVLYTQPKFVAKGQMGSNLMITFSSDQDQKGIFTFAFAFTQCKWTWLVILWYLEFNSIYFLLIQVHCGDAADQVREDEGRAAGIRDDRPDVGHLRRHQRAHRPGHELHRGPGRHPEAMRLLQLRVPHLLIPGEFLYPVYHHDIPVLSYIQSNTHESKAKRNENGD